MVVMAETEYLSPEKTERQSTSIEVGGTEALGIAATAEDTLTIDEEYEGEFTHTQKVKERGNNDDVGEIETISFTSY